MTFIKEAYHTSMTLREAEKLVLQTLKGVMEEKINRDNVEVAVVTTASKKLETRSRDYLEDIIVNLS